MEAAKSSDGFNSTTSLDLEKREEDTFWPGVSTTAVPGRRLANVSSTAQLARRSGAIFATTAASNK